MTAIDWEVDQKSERLWWGSCVNTFGEEAKQLVYARYMSLSFFHTGNSPFNINVDGKSILDIGGGPSSLLLKCTNLGRGYVIDPCRYPDWVMDRYRMAGINYTRAKAEDLGNLKVDEVWIYNVLQHTDNPEEIVKRARQASGVIRVFEWVDIPPHEGHPHMLTEEGLDKWFGDKGCISYLSGENECFGKAYFGTFKKGVSPQG